MTMAHRRSWQQHHVGFVHWTVEAEPVDIDRNLARHKGLASVTEQLFALFNRQRVSATWAVGDPAHSAVAGLVAASETKHALALLGDRHWIGPTAGRTRFAHELVRRLSQARAAGIDVATLVPRVAPIAEHIDLVVKNDIRVVVAPGDERLKPAVPAGPRALHYGVWQFSASERLPVQSSWLTGGMWKLGRAIHRAAQDAATVHLVIDAPAMEHAGRAALRSLERLMRRVAKLRDRGLVETETLCAAATRLSDFPAAKPQRSILRAA